MIAPLPALYCNNNTSRYLGLILINKFYKSSYNSLSHNLSSKFDSFLSLQISEFQSSESLINTKLKLSLAQISPSLFEYIDKTNSK